MYAALLRPAILILTATLPLLLGQGAASRPPKTTLSSTERQAVERDALVFLEKDEEGQRNFLRGLARVGGSGRAIITDLQKAKPESRAPSAILKALDSLLGLDLLAKPMSVPASPWSLWTFAAGDVIVLKSPGLWVALRVDPKMNRELSELTIDYALTKDPLLPFSGPGIERGQVKPLGKPAEIAGSRRSAYQPFEYQITVSDLRLTIQSVGSIAFRCRHDDGGPLIARAPRPDWKGLKANDPKLVYRERPDPDTGNRCRRLQQYAFRTVRGVKPLPTYDTPDEIRYAHAESVQVEMRDDGEQSLSLVAFPFAEELNFNKDDFDLIHGFAARVFGIEKPTVLLWFGQSEAREANRFWEGTAFTVPKGELLKKVRRLYPEDY